MSTETDKLEVPDEAVDELFNVTGAFMRQSDDPDEFVRAIATPVVIAELREWAEAAGIHGYSVMADALRIKIRMLEAGQ